MKIIKFGGTSLINQNSIDNTISIITSLKKPLIVVVSAIGRKGFPFATDTLIDLIGDKKISNKEYDRLLSLGEIYASIFLSNICNKRGIKAYATSYLEIGIECNNDYGKGRVDILSNNSINKLLKDNEVIIVPGFIGNTKDNEIITFGRNTSDYSCVLLGGMFKEKVVNIYKDVDGVYATSINTINNKILPYDYLSYDEMKALCSIGFKIINIRAIEEAKNNDIDILIINQNTKKEGTLISNRSSLKKLLGFNIIGDEILIASLHPNDLLNETNMLFKTQHVFIKETKVEMNYIKLKVNINQIMIIKQLLFNFYLVKKA